MTLLKSTVSHASVQDRKVAEKRIRVAVASARMEGFQVTKATESLIREHVDCKLSSDEVVDKIIKICTTGG